MWKFISLKNKIIQNRVEILLNAMLWYAMVRYDEWKCKDMLWESNFKIWDFNAMVCDFNDVLCYGVCCKRYAWIDYDVLLSCKTIIAM